MMRRGVAFFLHRHGHGVHGHHLEFTSSLQGFLHHTNILGFGTGKVAVVVVVVASNMTVVATLGRS